MYYQFLDGPGIIFFSPHLFTKLDDSIIGEQNIASFDIAMYSIVCMKILEPE
jgi:hypothetical protein